MTCPVCGGKNYVVDSRSDVDAVYRKRICKECGHEFFTVEFETESTAGREAEDVTEAFNESA